MLHNDGLYGPSEAPDNLGAVVNTGAINASLNLSHNMNNFGKMGQQPTQDPGGRYHAPEFPIYNHPNLSQGPQLSSYPSYPTMGFQPTYSHQNSASIHSAEWQGSLLPPHLNPQPFHNQTMLNYPAHYERTASNMHNQAYVDTSLRHIPINIPQAPMKNFHKHDTESMFGPSHEKNNEPNNMDSIGFVTKSTDRPLLDNTKRKSLENTVRLIENILSSTAKNRAMEKNQVLYSFLSENKVQENNLQDKSSHQAKHTPTVQQEFTNTTANHKVDTGNSRNIMNYYNETKNDSIPTQNSRNSDEDSEMSSENEENEKISQNFDKHYTSSETNNFPDRSYSKETTGNATNMSTEQPISKSPKKEHVDNQCDQGDHNQKGLTVSMIKVEIETERADSEMETQIDVKVEPIFWNDLEDVGPFQRDVNGKTSDQVGSANIVEGDDCVNIAKEAAKTGYHSPNTYYECTNCSLLFANPKRYLIHHKWHSFGLTNDKRSEMARHRQMWRDQRKEARVLNKMNAKETAQPGDGKKLVCKDCDKLFRSKSSLKNHRHRYHPTRSFECEICKQQVLGSLAFKAHVAAHTGDGPGFQCPDCDKRFVYAHSLTKHRGTHLEKTLQCPQCPKKFGTTSQLKMHQKVHERAERGTTFRCSYCAKGFYESYNLMVHERTHRGERPFLCDICNTSYGTNSSLKRHLKVSHSTAKPFECATCHRSFATESTRDRHEIRQHGDPDQLQFPCELCGNRYLHQRDLTKHVYKAHKKGKRKKISDSD